MPDVAFHWRLLALLVFLGAVAGVEWLRKREEANRWREFAFLLAAAVAGGVFGALVDQVTVTLSPEYFVAGKGLAQGDGLRLRAGYMGFQAGFLGGAVASGVLLVANTPRAGQPLLSFRALWVCALLPLAGALLLAPGGALLGSLDPLDLRPDVYGAVARVRAPAFLRVWGIHAGLYLGAILGLGVAVWRVRRLRAQPLT